VAEHRLRCIVIQVIADQIRSFSWHGEQEVSTRRLG
jgi:hypothetical protein